MAVVRFVLAGMLALLSTGAGAVPLSPEQVPEPLKPWISWALKGHENLACPFSFNAPDSRRCQWPARLTLELSERGGRFDAAFQIYADGWTALPGDDGHWPQQVRVDGKPAVVTPDGDTPRLWLTRGTHAVDGQFVWDRLPENLSVPREAGLLTLRVGGRDVPFPVFNDQGQLWVQTDAAAAGGRPEIENRMDLQVFRRIADDIPMLVTTRLSLNVSGLPREVLLKGVLLGGFVPLSVDSPLPARVEEDGTLRLQLRPGAWEVDVVARAPGAVDALPLPEPAEPWPAEELWAFEAHNPLRMVQIEGVTAIDPRQTNLPEDWKSLPAYQVSGGATMAFQVLRRGDPEPEPDSLTLTRQLWLDFDGSGFTANDAIGGRMTRAWRLDAAEPMRLGRVSIDGQPQSITRMNDQGPAGVEVRRGAIRLSADSRFEGTGGTLPATGWSTDFHQVQTELNLPPGWRLVAAFGVDHAPATWVGRWTLLDLFVVLIASLAAARLWRVPVGGITLLVLALLWHEPGAPRYVWLSLLVAIALLRVLPEGRFALGVRVFRNICLGALVLIAIPFAYNQVRFGLYPQLEMPWLGAPEASVAERAAAPMPAAAPPQADEAVSSDGSEGETAVGAASDYITPRLKRYQAIPESTRQAAKYGEIDPNAVTQTGPGLPRWRWRQISLNWNGPVVGGQEIRLLLLSPTVNLLLNVARVALLLLLAALFVGLRRKPGGGVAVLSLVLLFMPTPDARADYPDAQLLQQLSERLTEAPGCLPACAEIPRLLLKATPGELQQTVEIHAAQRVGIPLPAQDDQWLPNRGTLDGKPIDSLIRSDGGLWIGVEPGAHMLVLTGPLPQREQIQLPLPLKPRRVEVEASGWQVEGVEDNGVPDTQLRLLRLASGPREPSTHLEPRPLAPFVAVERTLQIGLDWRVSTTVRRLSPADAPISLEVPLLAGEAVTSSGLTAKNGRLSVNLPPGAGELSWDSVLEKRPELMLKAPDTTQWTETWRVDVSPVWHMETQGIAVVHHQDAGGSWLPEWRPWPGEEIRLSFVRPTGAPGATLTIDDSSLALTPGLRATDATLGMTIRSAQGTQHTVTLPEGAQLQSVTLDGTTQPIRQQGAQVTIPLHPGAQTVALNWRTDQGITAMFRTPKVDIGSASVNSSLRVSLGQDRWTLLLGGPQWGPAVLFWGLIAVIAGIAVLLGRVDWTPLGTLSWLLLLLGLSQINVVGGLLVVGWLLAMGRRAKLPAGLDDNPFNAMQIGLGVLTAVALLLLLHAVEQGLLGLPEMQIAGGGSSAYDLRWYQDRSGAELPQAWILSVPLWVYRVAMLVWALWLALSLLGWLRWAWECFSSGGLWRHRPPEVEPAPAAPAAADPWTQEPPKST
ncbi:MAG: hypothetical protein U1E83_06840 [Methylotetracoccus sp.]